MNIELIGALYSDSTALSQRQLQKYSEKLVANYCLERLSI